jgi:hypothetical protein
MLFVKEKLGKKWVRIEIIFKFSPVNLIYIIIFILLGRGWKRIVESGPSRQDV